MAYEVKVLADSISPQEHRLTTMEVTLPRMVLAEFNTHRVFSRNSASSRAIPVEKQLGRVLEDPFVPVSWGVNQPGMQASTELEGQERLQAEEIWLKSRDKAVLGAVALIGGVESLKDTSLAERISAIEEREQAPEALPTPVHKQIANRLLEPYMWHTVLVTSTEWDNFYALRANKDAQPEIRIAAEMMKDVHQASAPQQLKADEWHLPLIDKEKDSEALELAVDLNEQAINVLKKVAVGRCARVSYLTHDGTRDLEKDIELYERLTTSGHMSPLEHVARPMTDNELAATEWSGNFRGWHQFRKDVPNEDNFGEVVKSE